MIIKEYSNQQKLNENKEMQSNMAFKVISTNESNFHIYFKDTQVRDYVYLVLYL